MLHPMRVVTWTDRPATAMGSPRMHSWMRRREAASALGVAVDGHDDERPAAVATDDVVIANDRLDATSDGLEQLVGHGGPLALAEASEAFDVDQETRERGSPALAAAPFAREALDHLQAVPDTRHGVDERNLRELHLDLVKHPRLLLQLGLGTPQLLDEPALDGLQAAHARDHAALDREEAVLDEAIGLVVLRVRDLHEDLFTAGGAHELA